MLRRDQMGEGEVVPVLSFRTVQEIPVAAPGREDLSRPFPNGMELFLHAV
jgi:hypothetical protein